ncbi:arsenate reductase/protein-tyrosine-phosphatase family protein [Streptomyces violascens]|uniref:arsenate reductase/protein-tyrosine-phosphatase family protein n=1 Tax=Streptomyces violascens TaxID=67381 RepID=UPI00167B2FF9|nr:low molecular weight phosphotyrosine protein phosphatase [Streptomyces violascens]GGU52284.1 protein-tyrosine-phosphatase [Streptomyces violascens]
MTSAHAPRRILTVCLGNYCRSPFACLVLQIQGGGALEVRSAGLIDKWVGGPAHPNMIKAAKACGYDLTSHQATQVDKPLLDWADLILAMDHCLLDQLHLLGGEDTTAKLRLYLDDGQDVPDPIGKRLKDFADCAAIIEAGAAHHLS